MSHKEMTKEQVVEQLQELIDDREEMRKHSEDKGVRDIFAYDIKALKAAIKYIKGSEHPINYEK